MFCQKVFGIEKNHFMSNWTAFQNSWIVATIRRSYVKIYFLKNNFLFFESVTVLVLRYLNEWDESARRTYMLQNRPNRYDRRQKPLRTRGHGASAADYIHVAKTKPGTGAVAPLWRQGEFCRLSSSRTALQFKCYTCTVAIAQQYAADLSQQDLGK